MTTDSKPLSGKVALVAGATRGAGRAFALELAHAGATVYATGRSTAGSRSEMDRPETIEETARLTTGDIIPVVCDHLDTRQVQRLVERIDREQGRLHILINNIWGGDHLTGWDKKMWEHDLDDGLHLLHLAVDTHLITGHYAIPLLIRQPGGLLIEVTDGTAEFNADYRGTFFYDLAKVTPHRVAWDLSRELEEFGTTALSLTPGWIRSEAMLDHFGVTEDNWRDADDEHFHISESPGYVARGAVALARDPEVSRFNGKSLASWDLGEIYKVTDRDGSRPHFLRYYREVILPGATADVTGYR